MTERELAELLHHCPTLYHMAMGGSWPSIRLRGLLSTSALLDLAGMTGDARRVLEAAHRPACVAVAEGAVLRDQKPMSDGALARCLQDGLTPADWYRMLNGRVFFWLSRERLLRLLGGREYRQAEHDVLEVDSAAFVSAYRDRIELSPINSGATFALGPAPRGLATFRRIDVYDYAAMRAKHPPRRCVVEMTVPGGVPDVAQFTRRVVRMRGADGLQTLFGE